MSEPPRDCCASKYCFNGGIVSASWYDLPALLAEHSPVGVVHLGGLDDSEAVFTVAYVVRAVTPGKYVLPQAYVEDMYNPSRYGRTGTGSVAVRSAK